MKVLVRYCPCGEKIDPVPEKILQGRPQPKRCSLTCLRDYCDNAANHTLCPDQLVWHEWADQMSETHNQERCPGCGLYVIWTPKKKK